MKLAVIFGYDDQFAYAYGEKRDAGRARGKPLSILALVAIRIFNNIGEGCQRMIGLRKAILPRPENRKIY